VEDQPGRAGALARGDAGRVADAVDGERDRRRGRAARERQHVDALGAAISSVTDCPTGAGPELQVGRAGAGDHVDLDRAATVAVPKLAWEMSSAFTSVPVTPLVR
jgi:hypothetical protein